MLLLCLVYAILSNYFNVNTIAHSIIGVPIAEPHFLYPDIAQVIEGAVNHIASRVKKDSNLINTYVSILGLLLLLYIDVLSVLHTGFLLLLFIDAVAIELFHRD
ncbi:hypothetical protein RYX36_037237, partial [Vicia faba]